MNRLHRTARLRIAAAAVLAAALPGAAGAERLADPLRFWEGRTESVSTVKVVMKKPFKSRSLGRGEIRPDGSLLLVQRVQEEGRPARERRWHIRKVASSRYAGTMNEASGPVTIEEVGGKFRFRFKMKGGLAVEQWLTPLPGGKAATNNVKVRKLGMTVATTEGLIRKVAAN